MTPAQTRAHRAHVAKLAASGVKAVTVRLSERARDTLGRLAVTHGSRHAALEHILTSRTPPP